MFSGSFRQNEEFAIDPLDFSGDFLQDDIESFELGTCLVGVVLLLLVGVDFELDQIQGLLDLKQIVFAEKLEGLKTANQILEDVIDDVGLLLQVLGDYVFLLELVLDDFDQELLVVGVLDALGLHAQQLLVVELVDFVLGFLEGVFVSKGAHQVLLDQTADSVDGLVQLAFPRGFDLSLDDVVRLPELQLENVFPHFPPQILAFLFVLIEEEVLFAGKAAMVGVEFNLLFPVTS